MFQIKAVKFFIAFLIIPCLPFLVQAKEVSEEKRLRIQEAYGKLLLYFIQNEGQVDGKVRFYERGSGRRIFFREDAIYVSLFKREKEEKGLERGRAVKEEGKVISEHLLIKPLNGKLVEPVAEERLSGKVDYFIGNNPKRWKTDIPTYGKVRYREVYPGIDLVFYGNQS